MHLLSFTNDVAAGVVVVVGSTRYCHRARGHLKKASKKINCHGENSRLAPKRRSPKPERSKAGAIMAKEAVKVAAEEATKQAAKVAGALY